jgi:hypothetical protein
MGHGMGLRVAIFSGCVMWNTCVQALQGTVEADEQGPGPLCLNANWMGPSGQACFVACHHVLMYCITAVASHEHTCKKAITADAVNLSMRSTPD